ncbi:MAG: HupE/UreJ family protein [Myxococcales bacterium]|nr:HupE/UreJ family protein [Myxococcales bacterium]
MGGHRPQRREKPLYIGLFLLLWGWFCGPLSNEAKAHKIGLSKGTYTATPQGLQVVWDLAQGDLQLLLPKLHAHRDKKLTSASLHASHDAIEGLWRQRLLIWKGDKPCQAKLKETKPLEKDGVSIHLLYLCNKAKGDLRGRIDLLEDLAPSHRHLATIPSPKPRMLVLFRNNKTFSLKAGTSPSQKHHSFLVMGIEHILFGWDHILFLLALVLLGGSWRILLGIVTAFTVAHSITLSLSVMGYLVPSPKVIEPLIALSVAYVGIENFFVQKIDHRWMLTFAFGLIHGFGLAGALNEVHIPPQQAISALLFFNLGVEAGQLCLLVLALPLLHLAREKAWLTQRVTLAISSLVTLAGVLWFLERVFS